MVYISPLIRLAVQVSIVLTSVYSLSASAQTVELDRWRTLVPSEMQKLPDGILKWFITETDFLSKDVDPQIIASPHENDQNPLYKPENKNVFDLLGLWMPIEELHVYSSQSGELLKKRFLRIRDGKTQVLFLIHPESHAIYKHWLQAGYETQLFKAAATASSRSLLVWKPGDERNPFIAKVSLDKTIAKVNRNIKGEETATSVGISATLEGSSTLPKNFLFMKESFSAIPKGLARGGMILREFPEEMKTGSSHFIPLFALYGSHRPGFLLTELRGSKRSARSIITDDILRPFAKLWADLALEQGILMEPHAQNLLVELKDNHLTGRFLARDFGGFTLDFEYRKMRHLYVREPLPTFSGSVYNDYFLKQYAHNIRASLAIFFDGGFLYNIKIALKKWQDQNLIPKIGDFDPYLSFQSELAAALQEKTGKKPELGAYYEGIEKFVLENRLQQPALRIDFSSDTFDPLFPKCSQLFL